MLLHSAILPIELTNNNNGRTHHFGKSASNRKKYTRLLTQLGHRRKPFACQVDVVVTRILATNQRLWDSSSVLRGNWKELEDTLVELGWFVDDDTTWIRWTLGSQDATRRDIGPAVQVDTYEAGVIVVQVDR